MQTYQTILLSIFVLSTLHAAYKAINQGRERRLLGERELRWKQSEQARLILDGMEDDEFAEAAMLMLDWNGRPVTLAGTEHVFFWKDVDTALRVTKTTKFTVEEMTIRDCYDHLFYHFERISQWIRVGLISEYDVLFPVSYLADAMARRRQVFEAFLKKYGYEGSLALLNRFVSWGGDLNIASVPPSPPHRTAAQRLRDFLIDVDPVKPPEVDKFVVKPTPLPEP